MRPCGRRHPTTKWNGKLIPSICNPTRLPTSPIGSAVPANRRLACTIRRSMIHSWTVRPVRRRTVVVRCPADMLTSLATSRRESACG